MRRTEEDAAVTRLEILNAALHVFSRRGYTDTRLEDVAEAAGVTRGAVYHHFDGKADLFNSLLRERFANAYKPIVAIVKGPEPAFERIRRIVVHSLKSVENDANFREVLSMVLFKTPVVDELSSGMEEKRNGNRLYVEMLAALVKRGIDEGEVDPSVDPSSAAIGILGYVNGLSTHWLLDTSSFSLAERAEHLADLLLGGLRARNTAQPRRKKG